MLFSAYLVFDAFRDNLHSRSTVASAVLQNNTGNQEIEPTESIEFVHSEKRNKFTIHEDKTRRGAVALPVRAKQSITEDKSLKQTS
jgi:hypothetical protein